MKLNLRVWRQKNAEDFGRIEKYQIDGVSKDMSFLEMMDILNDQIELEGGEAIAFEHDCREGICGSCSMVINGRPHGPDTGTTACQLHMRRFKDGDTITVEPFRAKAFPVLKDLVVDRGAFDRIIQAGGYVSVNTGAPQDANALPVDKTQADAAFAAAECIGCGACVAACPNASAMLFVSSKITHLGLLPQGQPERASRALDMVNQMDAEGFGNCSNHLECSAACPKEITWLNITRMNRDYISASLKNPIED
jgi:succinate dehydrogenase / fumarate reductase iron-sulfur subunit